MVLLALQLLLLLHVALAAPPPQPQPVLLWECTTAGRSSQSWTSPLANGTISLASSSQASLTVLGWPAYAHNVQLLSAGPAAAATPLAWNGSGQLLAPGGACLGPLYGVPFHGAGVAAGACGPGSAWAYTPSDGTLRLAANASLCLDFGSTFSCSGPEGAGLLYCDAAAAPEARAADLVSRLTAAELSSLLSSGIIVQPLNYGTNLGLPARGLPPLWWSECCHGAVAACGDKGGAGGSGCPTSLPAGLSMGASFNASAWALAGTLVSTEARALYNQGLHGLGCFAPNVNPFRAPQWGRGAETPGEDPMLNGEFGAVYAGALQGEGQASVLRVLATIKHATAYDMEDSDGASRSSFNAVVSLRDLTEYFWLPFKTSVQRARPRFVMASYNAVNGVPSCASELFLTTMLRGQWGWQGAAITDCGGLQQVQTAHHYTNSTSATLAVALGAGLDCECGEWLATYGAAAVAQGVLPLPALRTAAQRTLTGWLAAGLLPSASSPDPYASLAGRDVDTASARALALEMAVQGAVLLRNSGGAAGAPPLLPLRNLTGRTLALIGPQGNATQCLLGPYAAPASSPVTSLAAALAARAGAEGYSLRIAAGCSDTACTDRSGFPAALAAAAGADIVIGAFGLCGEQEGEGHDRRNLTLPAGQEALLAALAAAAAPAAQPVALVLVHGGPLALPPAVMAAGASATFPAILTLQYPGQAGGLAGAALLLGDVSPSGRTTVTWYSEDFNAQRSVLDMQLQPHGGVPGITYKWYGGQALFQFGEGGSYTTFEYAWEGGSWVAVERGGGRQGAAPPAYAVNVTNTGLVVSDVSALAMVASGLPEEPIEELFAFDRAAAVRPGETRTLRFSVGQWAAARGRRAGEYTVRIGDVRSSSGNWVQGRLSVGATGE